MAWRNGEQLCGDTTSQGISRSTVRQGRIPGRLGETSDACFARFLPKLIILDEVVEDGEQLSHGCGQGEFLGLPLAEQSLRQAKKIILFIVNKRVFLRI